MIQEKTFYWYRVFRNVVAVDYYAFFPINSNTFLNPFYKTGKLKLRSTALLSWADCHPWWTAPYSNWTWKCLLHHRMDRRHSWDSAGLSKYMPLTFPVSHFSTKQQRNDYTIYHCISKTNKKFNHILLWKIWFCASESEL